MISVIFYAFLAYLLYRLVFHFIIPVYRTTRRVKKGFREMQEKMNQHMNGGQAEQDIPSKHTEQNKAGEYIDFEEIKK